MEKAIRKAIEGGWLKEYGYNLKWNNIHNFKFYTAEYDGEFTFKYTWEKATMDPIFWQCLGKAMGWSEIKHTHMVTGKEIVTKIWKEHWHYFIDHIADGGNTDDFFNKLLNDKN